MDCFIPRNDGWRNAMKLQIRDNNIITTIISVLALVITLIGCTNTEYIEEPDDPYITQLIEEMTLEEKLGQLLICRIPDGATTVDIFICQSEIGSTIHLISEYNVGGLVIFSENVESIEQMKAFTADLQANSKIPLFISIDEEGGRVSRIGKLYNHRIGSAGRVALVEGAAYNYGYDISLRLKELGINMNFAPVADIWSNKANTVIGDRAFGSEPSDVAYQVRHAVRGFQTNDIISVLKHFPGHGDTTEDSHIQLATYTGTKERFDSFESIPFKSGISAGGAGVMIGHIATPNIKGRPPSLDWLSVWHENGNLPATFSEYWIQDVLRGELGFEGLVITDALEMGALANNFTEEQIAVAAFVAGADILLIPQNPAVTLNALKKAYNEGIITEERLSESLRIILKTKIY